MPRATFYTAAARRSVSPRHVLALATLACAVLPFASHAQSSSSAQTSASIYGVVDAAVRHTTNDQPAGAPSAGKTQMLGGGMSQSRIGFNISEDLGGGLKALANLEHRLLLDSGTAAGNEFWQQSWVGLHTDYGRVTFGRQYNVLFDIYTSTYPSFKYSPFIEAYKPELGFSLGSRANNMVKYAAQLGPVKGELQASPSEGSALGGRTLGGLLRYDYRNFALGGAYMELTDGSGRKAKATTLGGSWSSGPWYLTASVARNRFETGYNPLLILAYLTSSTTNGIYGPNMDRRDGYSLGANYQASAALNLGAHYWRIKQVGVTTAGTGKGDFFAVVADYALSRRTDVYLEADHTQFSGALMYPNGAKSRTGMMAGLRHRF